MSAISKETAQKIALAYREVEVGETLLGQLKEAGGRGEAPDIRDVFGRHQGGLQLGVPVGNDGRRLFNVEWSLALTIIEAHIAQQRAVISALSELARIELSTP